MFILLTYTQIRNGISPNVFKLLIGQGHQEFSSKKQQDVQEYLLHLFNMIEVCVLTLVHYIWISTKTVLSWLKSQGLSLSVD